MLGEVLQQENKLIPPVVDKYRSLILDIQHPSTLCLVLKALPSQPTGLPCPTQGTHISNALAQLQFALKAPSSLNANVYQSGWGTISSPTWIKKYPNFHARCDELIDICLHKKASRIIWTLWGCPVLPSWSLCLDSPIEMHSFSLNGVLLCDQSVNLPWKGCGLDWFWSFIAYCKWKIWEQALRREQGAWGKRNWKGNNPGDTKDRL